MLSPEGGNGLSLVIGRGRKIEVGRRFDAPTLVGLMKVLERIKKYGPASDKLSDAQLKLLHQESGVSRE